MFKLNELLTVRNHFVLIEMKHDFHPFHCKVVLRGGYIMTPILPPLPLDSSAVKLKTPIG